MVKHEVVFLRDGIRQGSAGEFDTLEEARKVRDTLNDGLQPKAKAMGFVYGVTGGTTYKPQTIPCYSLAEYAEATQGKTCVLPACDGHLGALEHHPHEGGWLVKEFQKRQWLYRTCMKCGHENALDYLGVKRE